MKLTLISAPMTLGCARPGADLGPRALQAAKLGPSLQCAGHTISEWATLDIETEWTAHIGDRRLKYIDAIVAANRCLADLTESAANAGTLPVLLGGDHSMALGSIAGLARTGNLGVIWIDAHGDFNTPSSSPSGNVHGMPLAAIGGCADGGTDDSLEDSWQAMTHLSGAVPMIDPSRIVVVGARDLDPGEADRLSTTGSHLISMESVRATGIEAAIDTAIEIASAGGARIHVSFDVDALDPVFAPGTGTPVPGGFTYEQAVAGLLRLAKHGIASLDLVEVNPLLDDGNRTATVGVGLLLNALTGG